MRTFFSWQRSSRSDLKTALLVRICLMSAACLVAAALFAAYEARREENARATASAELVGKQLDLQLLRIATSLDSPRRFPDWDPAIVSLPLAGQCVQVRDSRDLMLRSHCVGTSHSEATAPVLFVSAWNRLFGKESTVERPIFFGGDRRATVVVTSDQSAVAERAWGQVRQLTVLGAVIALAISTLVYLAIAKALAPAGQLIAGLKRMQAGDFALRLPSSRLHELDAISAAANALAAKIETTLAERAELTQRLIHAQEEERRVLARELHDEYGQNLAAIAALAASIETASATSDPGLASEARTISHISGGMMQQLRGTLARLRPADVEDFGLDEALRQLVELWNARRHPRAQFALDIPEALGPLAPSTAMHVFRIAQEGLTNAARHADARNVDLRLEAIASPRLQDARSIRLTIEDDGKGAGIEPRVKNSGMGLLNMQERVAALGGTIDFASAPRGGLRVEVVIPVTPMSEARPL
jgi:signal transduction histidine kinase